MAETSALADNVAVVAAGLAETIVGISHAIHAAPELRFEERRAAELLTRTLRSDGFAVAAPAAELETAFVATFGRGAPTVALFAEYDALPGLGHACGHNIIAAISVGAAMIAKRVISEMRLAGTLAVIGSPAEEGGGGKIFMLERGALAGIDAALMLHPGDHDEPAPQTRAREGIDVDFHGKAAHAAAAPDRGIDATQAAVNFLVLVNSMRATLRSDANIHAIITDGGQAPNIIAERASVRMQIRARDREYLNVLLDRVIACATGAASAVGATMSWRRFVPAYAELRSDPALVEVLEREMEREGRVASPVEDPLGSTDMGNVSHAIPAVHGTIAIGPRGLAPHSQPFAAAAASGAGDAAALDGARILARSALTLLAAAGGDGGR